MSKNHRKLIRENNRKRISFELRTRRYRRLFPQLPKSVHALYELPNQLWWFAVTPCDRKLVEWRF